MSEATEIDRKRIQISETSQIVIIELNQLISMMLIHGEKVRASDVVQKAYVVDDGSLLWITEVKEVVTIPVVIPSEHWIYKQ